MGFTPAVSRDALISMGRVVRFWHLGRRSDLSLNDLAEHVNPVLRGWIHYYGRYYKWTFAVFVAEVALAGLTEIPSESS